MKGKTGPATSILRPILDMYMDTAVAVVGCHAKGIQRESCEWDVIVVTDERRPSSSLKLGGVSIDLSFVSEKEALTPPDPEHSMSMAIAKPVRDSSLVLSTSSAANSAVIQDSARKAAETRLTSATKTLGRAEEAIARDAVREADLWLLAASYEFAYAWMYSNEVIPSPSHLLSQLKSLPKSAPKYFEAVSAGAGLERATRAGCGSRLDGLVVLHDIVQGGPQGRGRTASSWSKARIDTVRSKAQELAQSIELAECYSYMGQEIVDHVIALTSKGPGGTASLSDLFSGEGALLSDRMLRGLGLSRNSQAIKTAIGPLRDQVSSLARSV